MHKEILLALHPEDAPGESDTMTGAQLFEGLALVLLVVLVALAIVWLVKFIRGYGRD